ncbi:competence type IV pilus minor pilin ComGG [Bacillus sp. B-jedd]|uniref:competence type IV pilus minor pilin ComGG n=1 Tax=Bacillus sp. B-jedd TaxID=1476857 RepID=UPI0005156EBE|nr:competence type IV pilus minor pilin ComGG [Bacillus sp. B-jedd]CEG27843.1 hypothetical protein BN1002_02716 [Bacillus sp. B-jedd]
MLRNEKGFTYPLALAFLLAFSVFLAMSAELLLIQEKMAKETEAALLEEYYLLSSLKKTEKMLRQEATYPNNGNFLFEKGFAQFTISPDAQGVQKVTLIVTIKDSHTVEGYGFYDPVQKKMIKWMEKN